MANFIDIEKAKPKDREYVLCYVPGFCESGYAVAQYRKSINKLPGTFEEEQYGLITTWVKQWQRIIKPKSRIEL